MGYDRRPLCGARNGVSRRMASSETATGKLLAARRSLRGTEWDGASLDHFVQVLCRLDADRHGFAVNDLQAFEAAWVGEAGETWLMLPLKGYCNSCSKIDPLTL